MSDIQSQEFKHSVKNFEQRVISRSITQLFFYSDIADKILQCFSAQTKPGTLSLLSFLPLCILTMFHIEAERLWFILTLIALFFHQVMDIANKKQAYRLNQFSLGTFYIDHIYDSLSCGVIVGIITRLMEFQVENVWICIFLFGFLPFYLVHIAMVAKGHLQFEEVNPASEGLFFIQILLLISAIYPPFFKIQLFGEITICTVVVVICSLWLAFYLLKQLWRIKSSKQKAESPLKAIFIIIVLGYIFFENTIIEKHLIKTKMFFAALQFLNLTHFSLVIGNLVINYGVKNRYPDLTINTLLVTTAIIILYSVSFLIPIEDQLEQFGCTIAMWVFAVLQFFYFVYIHKTVLNKINDANSE